ncbi:MAG: hypothetical protein ABIJ39_06050 [Chloroflexota bacterium]
MTRHKHSRIDQVRKSILRIIGILLVIVFLGCGSGVDAWRRIQR